MDDDNESIGRELKLGDFLEEATRLPRSDFIAKHQRPFLLLEAEEGGHEPPLFTFATLRLDDPQDSSRKSLKIDEVIAKLKQACANAAVLIINKQQDAFASIITLGRTPKSDVRINLASISKFHCYFTHNNRDHTWYLSDANSANGTYLDGQRLKPNVKVTIDDGAAIRLGLNVRARFFRAPAFFDYLQALHRSIQQAG